MRSSSDSADARGIGFSVMGAGFGVGSSSSLLVLRAALPSNWNKPARASSKRKSKFPGCTASKVFAVGIKIVYLSRNIASSVQRR
jgi:hypothetical protein